MRPKIVVLTAIAAALLGCDGNLSSQTGPMNGLSIGGLISEVNDAAVDKENELSKRVGDGISESESERAPFLSIEWISERLREMKIANANANAILTKENADKGENWR